MTKQHVNFNIVRPDDESVEIYLGHKLIASANHDEDGWGGIAKLEEIFMALEPKLNKHVDKLITKAVAKATKDKTRDAKPIPAED